MKTKRKFFLLLIAFQLLFLRPGKADEGMWLPFIINDLLYEQMQEMGLKLTREQIFSLNESSIKDAIVSFGGGCTAEIISSEGLLLTNHHCGYGRIQFHSTPENNILRDGFWAMTKEEELPNPGLFVRFLVSVADVTEEINNTLNDAMPLTERNNIIRQASADIVRKATNGTHYTGEVKAMFAGNEFYLFLYERFNDVRLVGTPPSAIGKYGGDTDNWMWPRHTGDFMLFRVYTAPDGKPADYSPGNIPLKPKHHLPVSARGVKDGDFAMILGFPGSTDRYLTSWGIEYKLEHELPVRIDIRRHKLDIIEAAMASSDEQRIRFASKQSSISNYWKNFIGMSNALKKHNVAQTKREQEEAFAKWVNASPQRTQEYGDVLKLFNEAYEGLRSFESFQFIHVETMNASADLLAIPRNFTRLATLLNNNAPQQEINNEVERLRGLLDNMYRNYEAGVDRQLWAAMTETYNRLVPQRLQPDIFLEVNRRFRGDFNRFADQVYKSSVFASRQSVERFLNKPNARTLQRDWAMRMTQALQQHSEMLANERSIYNEKLENARRLFIRGLREMDPDGLFYPDANSTMRFTFGSVRGYWPADAVFFDYITTLEGVFEKEDPNHHEFIVPEKLSELFKARNFGEWETDQTMIVNFISNNDITGGNSGSPVLDGEGNLIGLAFDGNWEAMSGDILFENRLQRSINVDARYILFIIDKYAGAGYLIDEMTIVR